MPTVTFTVEEFMELVRRSKIEVYPVNGYAGYNPTCPHCFMIQFEPATVGEIRNVHCVHCGREYNVHFRASFRSDGGGVHPVGTRHSIIEP